MSNLIARCSDKLLIGDTIIPTYQVRFVIYLFCSVLYSGKSGEVLYVVNV